MVSSSSDRRRGARRRRAPDGRNRGNTRATWGHGSPRIPCPLLSIPAGCPGFHGPGACPPRADSIRQVPGHAVPQAGVESTPTCGMSNQELMRKRIPPVAKTRPSGGCRFIQPARWYSMIPRGSRRPPVPSLSGIRPKLRRARQHRAAPVPMAHRRTVWFGAAWRGGWLRRPQRQEQLELDGVAARFWNGIEAVHVEDRGDEAEGEGCQRHEAQIERAANQRNSSRMSSTPNARPATSHRCGEPNW